MDIANIIESYQAMQATAERLAKADHPALVWAEGEGRLFMDDDIRLDVDYSNEDVVRCSGVTYTDAYFDFTVPASLFAEVLASV